VGASAAGVATEAEALWRSVSGARLLLAGAFARVDADATVSGVRRELAPMLHGGRGGGRAGRGGGAVGGAPGGGGAEGPSPLLGEGIVGPLDKAAVLRAWAPLLYKPACFPRPLANNPCLTPALAATLDQCGGGM
jgi:hypothetical protein